MDSKANHEVSSCLVVPGTENQFYKHSAELLSLVYVAIYTRVFVSFRRYTLIMEMRTAALQSPL